MKALYTAMTSMFQHAHQSMTADQLDDLSTSLADAAVAMARDSATVFEGIACLVDNDSDAGSLQDKESIFATLCLVSSKFDMIAGMVEVAGDARHHATQRNRHGVEK